MSSQNIYTSDVQATPQGGTSRPARDKTVAFLQIFGIWLVVIGHSLFACDGDGKPFLHTWIYSFHMPLFMFISGYLFAISMRRRGFPEKQLGLEDARKILLGKVRRLLVPYVAVSTLAFFLKALLNRFASRPVDVSWAGYFDMLLYPGHNVIILFWFLPTLFLIFCLTVGGLYGSQWLPRGSRMRRLLPMGVWAVLLALHLFNPLQEVRFLNISDVAHYGLYFISGYYFHRLAWGKTWDGRRLGTVLGVSVLLSFALLPLPVFIGRDVLTAFNGIWMSWLLARLYVMRGWRFFHPYFGASYAIYLFSWFPQVATQQIFMGLVPALWWVPTLLAMLTGFYIPFGIYKWMVAYKDRSKIAKVAAVLTGHA